MSIINFTVSVTTHSRTLREVIMKTDVTFYNLIIILTLFRAVELASPVVVSLTSTLNGRSMAYSGQEITFTCTTRDSQIISWSSNDYIGRDLQLEFISVDPAQLTLQSIINPDTIATLSSVGVENGSVVLVSTLQIVASSQFSSSSISCHHIGSGEINTTTIQVAAVPAQEMNSSLRQGLYACPGDRLNFICETRDSQVLAWSSDEYIGQNQQIEFLSFETAGTTRRSPSDTNTIAMLTNVTRQDGTLMIMCNLSITVLPSISNQGHSITCINVGVGTQNMTTFYLAENCDQKTTSDTVMVTETRQSSEMKSQFIDDQQIAAAINAMPDRGLMMILMLLALLLYRF